MNRAHSLGKLMLVFGLSFAAVFGVQANEQSPVSSEPSINNDLLGSHQAKLKEQPLMPARESLNIQASGFSPERAAIKAAGGLLLMVSVLFLVAYLAKRKGLMRSGGRRKLLLRETLSVGAKEKLAVVEFAGESMVVGITAHNIRLIRSVKKSEAEDYEANPALGAKNAFDFQTKLNDFLLKGSQ